MKKHIRYLIGAALAAAFLAVPLLNDPVVTLDARSQVDIPDVALFSGGTATNTTLHQIDHPDLGTTTVASVYSGKWSIARVVHVPRRFANTGTSTIVDYSSSEIDHPDLAGLTSATLDGTVITDEHSRVILQI